MFHRAIRNETSREDRTRKERCDHGTSVQNNIVNIIGASRESLRGFISYPITIYPKNDLQTDQPKQSADSWNVWFSY